MTASPDRPSLVLVHGAGSAGSVWGRLVGELGDRWPVLTPNLPGHGGDPPPGRESVAAYATWLEAFLASRLDEPCVLGGHSLGGAIVLEVALRRRVPLAGLVLISTGARLRVAPEVLEGLRSNYLGTLQALADYAYGPAAPAVLREEGKQRLALAGPSVVYADFAACDAFDTLNRLGEIAFPTLVICGTEDRMTPVKYSQYLAQQIPGAHLELIPGAGHHAPAEQPAAVAAAIAGFLDQLTTEWPEA